MNMSKRVLMIVTSVRTMGPGGRPTGVWVQELAEPQMLLQEAGIQVALASPAGGEIALDPGSVAGESSPLVQQWLQDDSAQAQRLNSLPVSGLKAEDFDAVFFPGGHGAMWDLPFDADVRRLVESAWSHQRWIAAVCHGVAGLVSAQDPVSGHPLVAGRRINSFTDAEERAVGLQDVVPFLLETRLRALGARFESANNWQSFAVQDGRLITGQNPQSSERVAQTLIQRLASA